MDGETKKETLGEREERILSDWNKNKIFEKTLEATKGGEPFVFFDGPPFATGLPHYGHLLAGTIKDVIPRFQTMRGRFVRRVWGWDCHGLPVENLIEAELGFKSKRDIDDFGVGKFNSLAESSVLKYDKEWKEIIPRMGRFVDMENAYKTMDAPYMFSVWWAFKSLYDKKYIYEGYKSMHICPRCETTLAASEVALGYKDVKDISVTVKFPLRDNPDVVFLAWTTTPWTLPGNVALAVNKDLTYARFTLEGENLTYIALKDAIPRIAKDAIITAEMKGSDLCGMAYIPPFMDYANDATLLNREKGWHVVSADFVTSEGGTGIVHIAPAFGEDDMNLGKEEQLPFIQHVGMDGRIKEEVAGFGGMMVKPKSDSERERLGTDIAVISYLQENGLFFSKENMVHSYPHCWRCDYPLLNYAASSWFVNVANLKEKAVEANKEINWVPDAVGHGRFHNWLEGARDWAISRSRYWGSPLPVWKCDECTNIRVIGGKEELRESQIARNNFFAIRHGESLSNVKDIVSCRVNDSDILTEKGKTQVKVATSFLEKMNIDIIVSSPIHRTKESAILVAEILKINPDNIIYDERIREVNLGNLDGHPNDEYRKMFSTIKEKFDRTVPGGESLSDMKRRFGEALYEYDEKYFGKNILFVTHEYGIWMLDAVSRGANLEETINLREGAGDDYISNAEVHSLNFVAIPHNGDYALDIHRPHIDDVKLPCECGSPMSRIKDVFDCWFESGSMPFAQHGFNGSEKDEAGVSFIKNFPAHFIAEGLDQTRGWFYTLMILSIGLFGKAPYKSVIVNGLVLTEDGQKMSKKLKNYPDPMELVSKYGADALRFYLISSPAVRGEDLKFSAIGVDEVAKKLTLRLDNVRSFYEMYKTGIEIKRKQLTPTNVLDKWIIARWNETHVEVTHYIETNELDKATKLILPLIDDLSTWWLRRSRDRLKGDGADRDEAETTMGFVLFQLSRILAPFTPFLADDLYAKIPVENKKESVHLEEWPTPSISATNIIETMESARNIVTLALEQRAKSGIKVRQPLSSITISNKEIVDNEELSSIIKDEINVKLILLDEKIEKGIVILDIEITPELHREGMMRDILRSVQEERKKSGFHFSDNATLSINGDQMIIGIVNAMKDMLKDEANIHEIKTDDTVESKLSFDGLSLGISLRKD
jgi:isoleucyl-tRNA synthetase